MITTAWSFLWPCKLNGVIYLTWRDSSVILISSSYRFCFMDCLEYRIHFHAIFLWSMVSVIYAMKLWPIISKDTLRSERLWYVQYNEHEKKEFTFIVIPYNLHKYTDKDCNDNQCLQTMHCTCAPKMK